MAKKQAQKILSSVKSEPYVPFLHMNMGMGLIGKNILGRGLGGAGGYICSIAWVCKYFLVWCGNFEISSSLRFFVKSNLGYLKF